MMIVIMIIIILALTMSRSFSVPSVDVNLFSSSQQPVEVSPVNPSDAGGGRRTER